MSFVRISFALFLAVSVAVTLSFANRKGAPALSQVERHYVSVPDLPNVLDFAGEKVPLESGYIREALERELLTTACMHTSTTLALRRSTRYFPVIEPI